MRFTTKAPEPVETPVLLSLRVDEDGEGELQANGIPILWVRRSGMITLNFAKPEQLRSLGFKINDQNKITLF